MKTFYFRRSSLQVIGLMAFAIVGIPSSISTNSMHYETPFGKGPEEI
jgi:hypothetical protein